MSQVTEFTLVCSCYYERCETASSPGLLQAAHTCVFVSPASRPHSNRVCSPSQPVREGEACVEHSLLPVKCEHAEGHCSCAPAGTSVCRNVLILKKANS